MIRNFAWDLLGKISGQVVSFIITVILTRLLLPEEFGIMGLSMSVITIASVLIGLGFNRAIIQKQEISDVQLNTIFLINIGIAIALTLICFFIATPLSMFYDLPLIKTVFQTLSIIFLFNGLSMIPTSLLYKRMDFKMATVFAITASVVSGIIGVIMAYSGFGVWALVTQALLNSLLTLVLNWFYIGWWPGKAISFSSVKPLWSYGSRVFASGLMDVFFTRIDAFVIGKVFSPVTLGYYTRAQSLDNVVKQFSSNTITSVLFPYISLHQNNREELTEIYKKYLHIISFLSVGLSAVFFLVANDLFAILFTPRWGYAAELFKLMAISGFAWPVSALMVSLIGGVGNAKAYLKLEVYKKMLLLPVYGFGFFIGLKGFILGVVAAFVISVWVNAIFVSKELHITGKQQLFIVFTYLLIGVVCTIVIQFVSTQLHSFSPHGRMSMTIVLFVLFFLFSAYFFKLDATVSLQSVLRRTMYFLYSKKK